MYVFQLKINLGLLLFSLLKIKLWSIPYYITFVTYSQRSRNGGFTVKHE